MKALILLAMVLVIFCDPSSKTGRRAAEMQALNEKLHRMLDGHAEHSIVLSDTTLFLSRDSTTYTHAMAKDKCRSFKGELASLTSIRKLDLLDEFYKSDGYSRWTSGKKDANKWKWGGGELIRPGARKFYANQDHTYKCLLYPSGDDYQLFREPCSSAAKITCELDGRQLDNAEFDAIPIKKMYVVVKQPLVNYSQAEAGCANPNIGGQLASPTTRKELDLIDQTMGDKKHFWLGGKRSGFAERDHWVTGEPIVDNLRKKRYDNGGHCLLYTGGNATEKSFDWFKCNGNEDWKLVDGYVCQIDG